MMGGDDHDTDPERTEARTSWLGKRPIAGSAVIATLTGVALQLTHMIDFQERVAALVGWNLSVRFVDFGFRMVLGAAVVLGLLPWLFGYVRSRPWWRGYLRYLRLTSGPVPRLTLWASAASVIITLAGRNPPLHWLALSLVTAPQLSGRRFVHPGRELIFVCEPHNFHNKDASRAATIMRHPHQAAIDQHYPSDIARFSECPRTASLSGC